MMLSTGGIVGVVVGGLLLVLVLIAFAVCAGVLVYGYRHPTSQIGLFMIEVCFFPLVLRLI